MNPVMLYSNHSQVLPYPGRASDTGRCNKGHFEIHSFEWLRQNFLLNEDREERLEGYEINWFKSYTGNLLVDSKFSKVKANSVFCFAPGQMRHYQEIKDISGYRISFSPDFLYMGATHTRIASWLDAYDAEMKIPVIEADSEMQHELDEIVRKMQKEYANYYLLRSEILSGLLNILLIYLSRKLPFNSNDLICTKDAELVRKFKTLLKEHFTTRKQVADYAGELCVTPNYLNRTVKKITGFTASHHIQQYIILEAKKQAIRSNVSMKEIAYFLGFDNLAHFSKFFKNNSGMNFTSFKRGLVQVE